MALSVFDFFTIGIGPSSSHTVGPMRAARRFALALESAGGLEKTAQIEVELFGSLAATGRGHGTDKAILLGLEGEEPHRVDLETLPARLDAIRSGGKLELLGRRPLAFREKDHLAFHRDRRLPFHPNGLRFTAYDRGGESLFSRLYYSVGGGFVVDESADGPRLVADSRPVPYPFDSAADLLKICERDSLAIWQVMLANENALRPEEETWSGLAEIWRAMQACVDRGCRAEGVLRGGLNLRRRAPDLLAKLQDRCAADDPLEILDWVSLFALAVSEENAAGGRVVTAPTNGAAGIVPAVMHYAWKFRPGFDDRAAGKFLLTAAAIATLYKKNASISGADVGCQGEVGSACSMAAGALAEFLGGTPLQVENAAEIGMEHNLGLTCDPIGGLVQIPCIERNAMGAVKALSAARMALRGDGRHFVSLDKVIRTMKQTGADMKDIYKETSRGGLAVNVIEC